MEKEKLNKWIELLKDMNSLNVVIFHLNKWGGFNFVIDDDLLGTIGEEPTKKLLEIYVEGFKKSIENAFKPFECKLSFKKSPPWYGKLKYCPGCSFIGTCNECTMISKEEKLKYKNGD